MNQAFCQIMYFYLCLIFLWVLLCRRRPASFSEISSLISLRIVISLIDSFQIFQNLDKKFFLMLVSLVNYLVEARANFDESPPRGALEGKGRSPAQSRNFHPKRHLMNEKVSSRKISCRKFRVKNVIFWSLKIIFYNYEFVSVSKIC